MDELPEGLFRKEMRGYTAAEIILFLSNIVLAGVIMFFANKLIQTQFGKASLTFGMAMLGLVTILKVLRKWGPRN